MDPYGDLHRISKFFTSTISHQVSLVLCIHPSSIYGPLYDSTCDLLWIRLVLSVKDMRLMKQADNPIGLRNEDS